MGVIRLLESQTGLWSNGFDWPKHWLIFKYVGDADVCKFRIPFRVGGSKSSYLWPRAPCPRARLYRAIMLICKLGYFKKLQRLLAKVGQMALTNYLSHSLICNFIFMGWGLGLAGTLQRIEIYYVVLELVFQIITSSLWLSYFDLVLPSGSGASNL